MNAHATLKTAREETRAEYLRRNIRETADHAHSLGVDHWRYDDLRKNEKVMRQELHEVEPFSISPNGPVWCVSHKGMFVMNGDDFLYFKTERAAAAWITKNADIYAQEQSA